MKWDKTLETQFIRAANHVKQQAVLRTEHQDPTDVEIIKFSWNETPAHVLNAPESSVPVSSTPVSRTGLRVLGGNEKGESGPPVSSSQPFPDTFDPLSPDQPGAHASAASVRGVDQKFTASIKNTGSKTISVVHWAYFFVPQDSKDGFAYVFTTKINIPPGKTKELRDELPSVVLPTDQTKTPSIQNRALFKERVVILRLDYADGSSWHSSGDGIKVDQKGNLYVSAPGGLWVISPEGKHLGTIITPRHPHNMAWDDADGKTLYLCARSGLYRIRLNIAGVRP